MPIDARKDDLVAWACSGQAEQDVQDLLDTVKFRNWKFTCQVEKDVYTPVVQINVRFDTIDTESPDLRVIQISTARRELLERIIDGADKPGSFFEHVIWSIIKDMLLHEAGEEFTINGRKQRHPHSNEERIAHAHAQGLKPPDDLKVEAPKRQP